VSRRRDQPSQTDGTSACSPSQAAGTPRLPLPHNSATSHRDFPPGAAAAGLLPGAWDLPAQLGRATPRQLRLSRLPCLKARRWLRCPSWAGPQLLRQMPHTQRGRPKSI